MFIDTTKKVSKVDEQNDNMRCCPEDQVVQLEYCTGMPQRPHTGNSPNMIHSSTKRTLGFIDETEFGNNETHCLSEKDLLTCSEECNYTNIQPIDNRCSNMNIKPREYSSIGPQTAVPSSQLQSSIMDDENGHRKVQRDVRVVKQRGQ
jgi:hypothetical protein